MPRTAVMAVFVTLVMSLYIMGTIINNLRCFVGTLTGDGDDASFSLPHKNKRPKTWAIVTFGTPDFLESWRDGLNTRTCYCAKHNCMSIVEVDPSSTSVNKGASPDTHWRKPETIKKYLPYYDWVMFLDLDVYITNFSLPLSFYEPNGVDEDYSVIVSDEEAAPTLAGMIAVRNDERGEAFLEKWLSIRSWATHPQGWMDADNGALIQTLIAYVDPENERACLDMANGYDYVGFNNCFHQQLDKAGPYGARKNKDIRFLEAEISWNKFCPEDLAARKDIFDGKLYQVTPSRHHVPGRDFVVHAKYETRPSRYVHPEHLSCDVLSF